MKNIKIIIITILLIFIFSIDVYAGVCEGYSIDNYSATCSSLNVTITKPSELNNKYGSYFLSPGYRATNSKGNALALCLDPGLSRPPSGIVLSNIRELTNDNIVLKKANVDFYDDGLYRIYQYFYKNLLEQKMNGGLTRDFVNENRAFFEYASRVWTYRHGFDYTDNSNAEYKIDAANFRTCSHYIDNNLFSGNSSIDEKYCFGTKKASIKNYYNAVNEEYLWTNPLKISTSTEIIEDSGAKYYVYKFKILFKDDKYSFFDEKYSQGISFDDIDLSKAFFSLEDLSINEISCTSGSCYDYSGPGEITSGEEVEFLVKLTEEQYNNFKNNSSDGTVNVSMKYKYQHPLNIENLYTARYDLKNSYQRMLIIQNYLHEDTETIGKEPATLSCKHTGIGEYYNNLGIKVSTLDEFLTTCNCDSVNKTLLSSSELTQYNNIAECNSKSTESYYGSINKCDSSTEYENVLDNITDQNYENYNLGYKKETIINEYCEETCIEDIKINNLKGKYTTKAGMYFEFDKYPDLTSQKRCTIDIDYDTWNEDYKDNLEVLRTKYNDWQEVLTVRSEKGSCCEECINEDGTSCGCNEYYYTYRTNYQKIEMQSSTQLIIGEWQLYPIGGQTCGEKNWSAEIAAAHKEFLAQATKEQAITNLKNDLKQCNNRLYGTNTVPITTEQFYSFSQELNYNYEQQYSNGNVILNSDRTNKYGINDSNFKFTQDPPVEVYNIDDLGEERDYSNLTVEGIQNETIKTYINNNNNNEDIQREVDYKVEYNRPFYKKYSETLTSTIVNNDNMTDFKNYMELGYGYDTDVSAIAQKGNKAYYSFSKLGDNNNKIFNHFKNENTIIRMCDYEITNDIIKTCEKGYCDSKLNVIYRSVDPINIDPNNRLSKDEGFANWKTTEAKVVKAKIEKDAKEYNTYSPENLEYSFTLDSAAIAAIRKDNEETLNNKYDVWEDEYFECTDGNKCESKFITKINEGIFTDSWDKEMNSFVTIKNGRTKWKEIIETSNGSNKYIIDGDTKNIIDLNS